MNLNDLEILIKTRRSIRKWKDTDIPDEMLKKAVEVSTWAPNGGNFQGWRFVVVKNSKVIHLMADNIQISVNKIAAWPESSSDKKLFQKHQKYAVAFRNAPVCIAVFAENHQSPLEKVLSSRSSFDPEAAEMLSFRQSAPTAIQNAAAAVTTLLLVFHQMGLGAVWLASPLLVKENIEKILNAPANFSLVCLVAVGYPDETPQANRRPVDEILEFVY
jgi:nitroreductase